MFNEAICKQLWMYESKCHYNDMNVLSMYALIGAYTLRGTLMDEQLRQVLEINIALASTSSRMRSKVYLSHKPEETYMIVPDFADWCKEHSNTLDELLRSGVEVGVLWRDGRQFHISPMAFDWFWGCQRENWRKFCSA